MRASEQDPPTAEDVRRAEQLAHLEHRYRTLMAEAKAEMDRAMATGQIVRVAGFIRSCKGRKKKPNP